MGTRFVEGFTYNLFSVYLLTYAVENVGVAKSTVLTAIMVGAALGVGLVVVSGAASDRLGRRPVFATGAAAALVFAFPAAWLVQSSTTVGIVDAFVGGLGVINGWVYGPLAAFWSELFDTRYRYSALSTLYEVSGVVASGFTPLIAAWLVAHGVARSGSSRRTPWSWRRSAWSRWRCCPRPAVAICTTTSLRSTRIGSSS